MFVRNALILLEEMDGKETMWISSSSNCLMKKCVTRLRGLISWPGLEAPEHLRKGKTHREQDVGESHVHKNTDQAIQNKIVPLIGGIEANFGSRSHLTPDSRTLSADAKRSEFPR